MITFTPSTGGNIFGDYSLKFRVTRHSSPLPIVPTRSNISTRSAIAALFPLPLLESKSVSLLEFSQGPEKCGGKLGRMATTTRGVETTTRYDHWKEDCIRDKRFNLRIFYVYVCMNEILYNFIITLI